MSTLASLHVIYLFWVFASIYIYKYKYEANKLVFKLVCACDHYFASSGLHVPYRSCKDVLLEIAMKKYNSGCAKSRYGEVYT